MEGEGVAGRVEEPCWCPRDPLDRPPARTRLQTQALVPEHLGSQLGCPRPLCASCPRLAGAALAWEAQWAPPVCLARQVALAAMAAGLQGMVVVDLG